MRLILCLLILLLAFPLPALSTYLRGSEQLAAHGAQFTWAEVESKTLRIFIEYEDREGKTQRASLGSGFLISPDGLFVTAYHVVKYCLGSQKEHSRFAVGVDCSAANPRIRYKAQNRDQEFGIEVLSHLTEQDSTNGKDHHSPDEIIKQRDFVIGKLKAKPGMRFSHWQLRDFDHRTINLHNPRADFELKPLLPPKKVFIAGYPQHRDLEVSSGFLNLADENRRGYFAANLAVYAPGYLESAGISPDTKWGIQVENQMSGGAVVDAAGHLVGIVVNGNNNTAGVLSIENVLATFFSTVAQAGTPPSVILAPNKTPLYLKESPKR